MNDNVKSWDITLNTTGEQQARIKGLLDDVRLQPPIITASHACHTLGGAGMRNGVEECPNWGGIAFKVDDTHTR